MDGWMDGWIDGWMKRWMKEDEWMEGWMDGLNKLVVSYKSTEERMRKDQKQIIWIFEQHS